jgi:polysaccharide deacetylase family protein (PEP-CTERM system associated)
MHGSVNALTVDVEDWYQGIEIEPEDWDCYESRIGDSLPRLLDLFAETNTQATFFILGWLAQRRPDLVRRIAAGGHEIGTHGLSHRLIYRMEPRQFSEELALSIKVLEDLTGKPVKAHRAPFFSITNQSLWAFDVLVENGIEMDSSVFPVRNYRYGIPDAPRRPYWQEAGGKRLAEFPLSTVQLLGRNVPVAGGFYLRAFPCSFLKWAFRSINRGGAPAILYIHPWEIDPDHPRLNLPKRIALPHYFNLRSTAGKLRSLLKAFHFAPLSSIVSELPA